MFAFKKIMNKFLSHLILFLLSFSACAEVGNVDVPNVTLFVPHEYWLTDLQSSELIDAAVSANIDGIAVNIWHGRGATWLSKVASLNSKVKNIKERDPLADLIRKAKDSNIKVIVIFSVSNRSSNLFPDYYTESGINKAYDLHNIQFQRFMLSMINEVVLNYDIDGVNLDYIRTKGICMSEICKADYKTKTDRNLYLDKKMHKYNDDAKNAIIDWNSEAVERILGGVKNILTKRPGLHLSVDSHPGHDGFKMQGADSIKWINMGLVDYIYSMNYQTITNMPKVKLNKVISKLLKPERLILTIGNFDRRKKEDISKTKSRNIDDLSDLVDYAMSFNPDNKKYAIFTYRFITDEQKLLFKDKNSAFK